MRKGRRNYPSWLPPNPRERIALRQIRRSQKLVILWMVGLLPAGWIAALLTRSDYLFVPLTVFWILVGIILAQRVAMNPCPRCGERFCADDQMPYWYSLFNRRCATCGLSLALDDATG
ncbi:MAG TPA: hypothetical protein VNU00_08745 [Candidatus Binataceae bacterium]|nr:hypothetical protein [Candidatus Binataceae bacterium]